MRDTFNDVITLFSIAHSDRPAVAVGISRVGMPVLIKLDKISVAHTTGTCAASQSQRICSCNSDNRI